MANITVNVQGMSPKKVRLLRTILDLGIAAAKKTPKVAKWMATTRSGAFTAGGMGGTVLGYKLSRKATRVASNYTIPKDRP